MSDEIGGLLTATSPIKGIIEEDIPTSIDFDDLKWIEIPVKYKGKKYLLIEANTEAARQFRNASSRGLKMQDGKVVGVEGAGDVEPLMISLCLFELYDVNENGQIVTKRRKLIREQINELPSRVAKRCFDTIMKISELNETETLDDKIKKRDKLDAEIKALQANEVQESAKNGQSGTMESSASPVT